jgi:hypothetical protein
MNYLLSNYLTRVDALLVSTAGGGISREQGRKQEDGDAELSTGFDRNKYSPMIARVDRKRRSLLKGIWKRRRTGRI